MLKRFGSRLGAAAAVAVSVLGAAAPTHAQSACAGYSDCLLVYDPNGAIVVADSIWVTEAQENANGAQFIYTSPVAIDASQFGNATVLTEPGTNADSDIFGIANVNGLALAFASDTETQSVNYGSFSRTFLETAAPFSATLYLDPGLQATGWTATFQSDTVPEASTWAMMMLGFAGLGFVAFRRGAKVSAAA